MEKFTKRKERKGRSKVISRKCGEKKKIFVNINIRKFYLPTELAGRIYGK